MRHSELNRPEEYAEWAPRGTLTIHRIAEAKDELTLILAQCEKLRIDLSAVTQVDTAGLQLLCSAHRTAALLQKSLLLTGSSAGFLEAVRETGLRLNIGCPLDCGESCVWVDCCNDGSGRKA